MTSRRCLASALAIAALLAAAAQAQPDDARGRGRRGAADAPARWRQLAERLDLTEQQKQAIDALHDAARPRQLELRKQLVQHEAQLASLMAADAPDEDAVLRLVAQIGDVRTELQANRIRVRLQVRAQLTPEQRARLIVSEGRGSGGRGAHRDAMPRWGGPGDERPRLGRGTCM